RYVLVRVSLLCPYTTLFLSTVLEGTGTTAVRTLSLHDALPIYRVGRERRSLRQAVIRSWRRSRARRARTVMGLQQRPDGALLQRSEEHTSELQSRGQLVCRLLLEKKKTIQV